MKRGLRKLCDIHCYLSDAYELRAELEKFLEGQRIAFECHSYTTRGGADFWRYAVAGADIRRAQAGLPLALRGWRAAGHAPHQGRHA